MKIKPFLLNLVALIAGVLFTLSFAPFHLFPLAILSPAILISLWLTIRPGQAFWRGLIYGVGFFGTGVYWIYISVHTFGDTSIFLACVITGGLIFLLSLFIGLNGYFLSRFFPRTNSTKLICAFPATWVLLECIRSLIFSGFPWLLAGYSQLNSPLRGFAPIFSVYGVSLAVIMSSGFLINTLRKLNQSKFKSAALNASAAIFIWLGGAGLNCLVWTTPVGAPIKVSLVQGNVAQELKWSADQIQPTLDHYMELTEDHWDSKIIVWPESAIPIPLSNAAEFLEELNKKALAHSTTFLIGIPMKAADREGYYNAVIAIGKGEGLYTKRRLVPFGEYIPLRPFLGKLLDLLHVPMSDFIPGITTPQPITADGLNIATFICYEIAYPELVRSDKDNIDLILTVSNDAWFGHSIAQAQHLEIAQMRALEMGRPVLFGSNDGITAIISNKGEILAQAPQYQSTVLTGNIQKAQGKTPWHSLGLDPLLLVSVALLIVALLRRKSSS